jgi:hypothetical protein
VPAWYYYFQINRHAKFLLFKLLYVLFQVFLGRPVLWGLAHSGEAGVVSIIRLLKKELDLAMALSGM